MIEKLTGKVAVMSGAGSGFAKATAELFAKTDKCGLVLFDINEAALKETVKNCEAAGSKVVWFVGDVMKPETFTRAVEETMKAFGRVDFLINYAGGAVKVAPLEEITDADMRRIIDLNLSSTVWSCRAFTSQFKKQKFGKIINVSSVCDRRSWPGWTVYSAAKAGVNAFSKVLYTELRPHGVCVSLLVPGGSNTGFQAAAQGVPKFEWDETLAVRPEHFADMVYQVCALSRGGCVSEFHLFGLAQDISGF